MCQYGDNDWCVLFMFFVIKYVVVLSVKSVKMARKIIFWKVKNSTTANLPKISTVWTTAVGSASSVSTSQLYSPPSWMFKSRKKIWLRNIRKWRHARRGRGFTLFRHNVYIIVYKLAAIFFSFGYQQSMIIGLTCVHAPTWFKNKSWYLHPKKWRVKVRQDLTCVGPNVQQYIFYIFGSLIVGQ